MLPPIVKRLPGPIRHWLELVDAKRKDKALRAEHKVAMKAAKTAHDREGANIDYVNELEMLWDPIFIRRSWRLAPADTD